MFLPTRFAILLFTEMQYQQTPTLQLNCSAPGAEKITDNCQKRKRIGHTRSYIKEHQKNRLGEDPPSKIYLWLFLLSFSAFWFPKKELEAAPSSVHRRDTVSEPVRPQLGWAV